MIGFKNNISYQISLLFPKAYLNIKGGSSSGASESYFSMFR